MELLCRWLGRERVWCGRRTSIAHIIPNAAMHRRLPLPATPTFATGMEEVASIADAGGYGTRFAVETTGPCPQYPNEALPQTDEVYRLARVV
jgi:hypothetical protein